MSSSPSARRLPASSVPLVTAFLLSVMMTCVVSGISTLLSIGFTPDMLWGRGFSGLVVFPTLLLVLPLVRRAVARIVVPPQ